jgi:hypothetical protein
MRCVIACTSRPAAPLRCGIMPVTAGCFHTCRKTCVFAFKTLIVLNPRFIHMTEKRPGVQATHGSLPSHTLEVLSAGSLMIVCTVCCQTGGLKPIRVTLLALHLGAECQSAEDVIYLLLVCSYVGQRTAASFYHSTITSLLEWMDVTLASYISLFCCTPVDPAVHCHQYRFLQLAYNHKRCCKPVVSRL